MKTLHLIILSFLLFSACEKQAPKNAGHPLLHSVLWVQQAAEYKASAFQAYQTAERMLEKALINPQWTAAAEQQGDYQSLPPAVILDVDETVLDNSPYETKLIQSGKSYSRDTWKAWCDAQRAKPVPGALEFCKYAHQKGVKVFYVTNRRENVKEVTRANLQRAGFPVEDEPNTVIPRTDSSDKGQRRASIAENYRILLLIGDNAGDFHSGFTHAPSAERDSLLMQYSDYFGSKWIILPNPMYGDWEGALIEYKYSLPVTEQISIKTKKLIP